MRIFRITRTIAAFILILTSIALVPLNIAAADGEGIYLSEVYIAYGKDEDSARKTLQDKGYIPVDGNLNPECDTYVMMGYKTTNEIRDSITDLAVMNMNGDYSVEDYKTLLKKQKESVAAAVEELMAVILEYRANLKAGKARAEYVRTMLNNYYDDDTGMSMGDLFNSETLQDKVGVMNSIEAENPDKLPDLVTILMQGNAQVIKSMEVILSMAADSSDSTWMDRFAEADYDTLLDNLEDERPDLNSESKRVQYLDNLYGEDAAMIGVAVLELRNRLLDYEASDLHIDTVTEEEITEAFGDDNEDLEAKNNEKEWLDIGIIYENLKEYEGGRFEKGDLLDFFLEENDPEDMELYIPMVAALSEGQRCGMIFIGLEDLLRYSFTADEDWAQMYEEYIGIRGDSEPLSVFENIDRDLYKDDGSVALTGAAQRANNTADGTTGDEENQDFTFARICSITYTATVCSLLASSIVYAVRYDFVKNAANDCFTGWINEDIERIYNKAKFEQYVAEVSQLKDMEEIKGLRHIGELSSARYMVFLSRIFIITTMVLSVISTVLYIISYFEDESIQQLPIPKYLVDNYTDADGGSYALNYKAVECNRMEYFGEGYTRQKGSSADLNADEGKQWLVLYASKNSKAGKPILANLMVKDNADEPRENMFRNEKWQPVHLFGEKGGVNISGSAFKNYSTYTYFFYMDWVNGKRTYIFALHSNDTKTYDPSAGNMTATAMSSGMIALFGFGGMALGAVLGAVGTVFVIKNKKKREYA